MPFYTHTEIIYKALDVFIMSSLSEPYGMVTLEALLSGTNVIGTNTGGTKELLNNGEYGQLILPNDEHQLSKAILEIYNKKYSINNDLIGIRINQKYDYKNIIKNYLKLLK